MTADVAFSESDFWGPDFDIERRADGTICMRQKGELPGSLPTLADYLDKWADATPARTWIARRENGGDWRRISYGEARASMANAQPAALSPAVAVHCPA